MAENGLSVRQGGQLADSRQPVPRNAPRKKRWRLLIGAAVSAWLIGLFLGWLGPRPGVTDQPSDPVAQEYPFPQLEFKPALTPQYRALLEEAHAAVRRLTESYPESADAAAAAARVCYLAHNPAGEVECWERCLRLEPDRREAHSRLGELALESGQYERAAALMRRALAADPRFPAFHNLLAHALINLGEPEKAVEVAVSHLKTNPASVLTHVLAGEGYLQLSQADSAKRHFEAAVDLDPAYTRAYHGLATACTRLGEEEKAAEYREKFKSLKTKDQEAEKRYGFREYEDEVLPPRHVAEIMMIAGLVYVAHDRVEQAEEHLRRAAALMPTDPECRKALASLYDRHGRLEEALRVTGELLVIEPYNVIHHRNMGILCARLNRFDEAEQAFANVCTLAPREAVGYVALAELCLRAHRKLPQARQLALKAVELEPGAHNYFILAAVCESGGDLAGARSAMQQATALDPTNAQYQQMYRMIREKE